MTGTYNRQLFFDQVRGNPFGGSLTNSQVEGMEVLLAYIDYLKWHPTKQDNQYFNYWNAYNFATTFHETAYTMQPVTEYGSSSYLKSKPYYPYIGRGYVQMTWESNYQRSDREIAANKLISQATLDELSDGTVEQHAHPEQALIPEIAACNLMVGCWKGWWTGRKLTHYLTNDSKDYINARRIVNGTDKANKIANYAEAFEAALVAAWQSTHVELPPPNFPPPMPEPPPDGQLPPPGQPEGGTVPEEILALFAETGAHEIRLTKKLGRKNVEVIYHRSQLTRPNSL